MPVPLGLYVGTAGSRGGGAQLLGGTPLHLQASRIQGDLLAGTRDTDDRNLPRKDVIERKQSSCILLPFESIFMFRVDKKWPGECTTSSFAGRTGVDGFN